MWESEREMVDEMSELGQGMLLHYCLWAERRDERYDFIATERKFKIPMPVPESETRGRGYKYNARRGMYMDGSGWVSGTMEYAGRFDGIVQDKETGELYLLEFKTTRSMHNMRWTFRGMQSTAYVWAASQLLEEAHGRLSGIMYRVLWKKLPDGPKPLVRGGYSQAKSQKTSFAYFKYCLDKLADRDGRDRKEMYRENEDILRYLHENGTKFFNETILDRTPQQIDSTMRCLYHIGKRMSDPDVPIFPQPGFHCGWCSFEMPCSTKEAGGDYEGILEIEYAQRGYWEDEEELMEQND